jgi:hypothetical protein
MTTRREFFRLAAQSATVAMLAGNHSAAAEQNEVHRVTPRRGRPLLDLQQRFVDLRFGMFVHFNMATFQDREWGDPTSPADLFHPGALDTHCAYLLSAHNSANAPRIASVVGVVGEIAAGVVAELSIAETNGAGAGILRGVVGRLWS